MTDKHDDILDFSVAIVTWAMARGKSMIWTVTM